MFSIRLNGALIVDGFLHAPGLIALASWHSTTPLLSSACSEAASSKLTPATLWTHARADASSAGSYLAAALAASSLSIP